MKAEIRDENLDYDREGAPLGDRPDEPVKSDRFGQWARRGCAIFLVLLLLGAAVLGVAYRLFRTSRISREPAVLTLDSASERRMDLSLLFESDQAWEDGMERLDVLVTDIEKIGGDISSAPETLVKVLRLNRQVNVLLDDLEVYANLKSDTDLDFGEAADMAEQIEAKKSETLGRLAFLDEAVTAIPVETLKTWSEMGVFAPFRDDMAYWIEYHDYGFSADRDGLIAESRRLGDFPEEVFESFRNSSGLSDTVVDIGALTSSRRAVRERAYQAMYTKNGAGREVLASALEGEVTANNYFARLAGYDSAFEMALEADGISLEDYDQFQEKVKEGLGLMHRWIALKKELKGIEPSEKLHGYDAYLPWTTPGMNRRTLIQFDSAADLVKSGLDVLGKEYAVVLDGLMASDTLDILPRDDKVTGAYTWGTYRSKPFILLNYSGAFDDILTLAHEMGHAVHHELARSEQSYSDFSPTVLSSEMVATTNEALVLEYLLLHENVLPEQSRAEILVAYAQSIEQTVFQQLLASEFQQRIHKEAKLGLNLDGEHLSAIWSELIQEYYGPAYEVDEIDGLGWTDVQHFYWGFYVQKYAIGYAAGISNAARIVAGEEGIAARYVDIQKRGGLDRSAEVLESLGYGPSGQAAVFHLLDRFESLIAEIERLKQ